MTLKPETRWGQTFSRLKRVTVSEAPQPVVYFISAAGKPRHPVKVGVSSTANIHNRLSQIQTGYPYDLEIVLVMHGDRETEQAIHAALSFCRLRGEWFKRSKLLLDFMRDIENGDPGWRRLLSPIQVAPKPCAYRSRTGVFADVPAMRTI